MKITPQVRVGALLLTVALSASACDIASRAGAGGGGGPVKACDIELIEPVISPDHPGFIEAITRAECDHAPDTHIVHLYIEEELTPGLWNPVESPDHNIYTECTEVPTPGHDAQCVRLIECFDGHYRTTASVTGEGQGQPFAYQPSVFPDSQIRCPA
jgi:hypothetical protein